MPTQALWPNVSKSADVKPAKIIAKLAVQTKMVCIVTNEFSRRSNSSSTRMPNQDGANFLTGANAAAQPRAPPNKILTYSDILSGSHLFCSKMNFKSRSGNTLYSISTKMNVDVTTKATEIQPNQCLSQTAV